MNIATIESILHEGFYLIRMNKDHWFIETDKDGYERLDSDKAKDIEAEYQAQVIREKGKRLYINMTDDKFSGIEFVTTVALAKESVEKVIEAHSKLPHSTGYYLVTDLQGYREEVSVA